jgi:lipopolysaccharide transport system permease protein
MACGGRELEIRGDVTRATWRSVAPPRRWPALELRELIEHRDLVSFLVRRDVKVLYRQTVLGFSWAILRPLLSMLIFTVVFGKIAGISSDGVPYAAFSYVALVPWIYFSSALSASATSLIMQVDVLTKVYVPRLVFPLTPVLSHLLDFLIALALAALLVVFFGISPSWQLVFVPLLVAVMMLTAAGFGIWLSALGIQYRDVKHATPFLAQVLMYAAPVVWPLSALSDRYGETARLAYGLYPMVGVIEGFRSSILGSQPMPWDVISVGTVSALIICGTGVVYFKHMEQRFADVA